MNVNAAVQHVASVGEHQLRPAATEDLSENRAERIVNFVEGLFKERLHLVGNAVDQFRQLPRGFFQIVLLRRQIGVAFLDLVQLVDRAGIHVAKGALF